MNDLARNTVLMASPGSACIADFENIALDDGNSHLLTKRNRQREMNKCLGASTRYADPSPKTSKPHPTQRNQSEVIRFDWEFSTALRLGFRYEPIHCTYNTIAKNQFVVRLDGADFMRFLLAGMERKSRAILKTVGYCEQPIWSHQPSGSASPQTSPPKKAYTSRNTIYFSGLSTIRYDSETHYDSTMHVIVTYRILRIVVLPVGHADPTLPNQTIPCPLTFACATFPALLSPAYSKRALDANASTILLLSSVGRVSVKHGLSGSTGYPGQFGIRKSGLCPVTAMVEVVGLKPCFFRIPAGCWAAGPAVGALSHAKVKYVMLLVQDIENFGLNFIAWKKGEVFWDSKAAGLNQIDFACLLLTAKKGYGATENLGAVFETCGIGSLGGRIGGTFVTILEIQATNTIMLLQFWRQWKMNSAIIIGYEGENIPLRGVAGLDFRHPTLNPAKPRYLPRSRRSFLELINDSLPENKMEGHGSKRVRMNILGKIGEHQGFPVSQQRAMEGLENERLENDSRPPPFLPLLLALFVMAMVRNSRRINSNFKTEDTCYAAKRLLRQRSLSFETPLKRLQGITRGTSCYLKCGSCYHFDTKGSTYFDNLGNNGLRMIISIPTQSFSQEYKMRGTCLLMFVKNTVGYGKLVDKHSSGLMVMVNILIGYCFLVSFSLQINTTIYRATVGLVLCAVFGRIRIGAELKELSGRILHCFNAVSFLSITLTFSRKYQENNGWFGRYHFGNQMAFTGTLQGRTGLHFITYH
ncbi:uncharacterized protein BDR25DRAFT_395630 [Lindgomyces ingoldianus]|uniref:Uncharacterized protein n=1 Tax=Lindgomyces ingoldianus TaxID=673940 RepID=A0ACB6QIH4_9PLEO|nr:uncharacterized protein BDR25DRAFT_395630 [Lindgomyces ingoldianus]KAF2466749.1 hypothetical protein BDR25DRAFT_395630 [Lindgomyces ingoldianus]